MYEGKMTFGKMTEGKMTFERTECLKEVELHSTFINTSVKVKEQE